MIPVGLYKPKGKLIRKLLSDYFLNPLIFSPFFYFLDLDKICSGRGSQPAAGVPLCPPVVQFACQSDILVQSAKQQLW